MNELEQKFVSLQREYQIILNERNQLKDQVASYADQLQSTHSQLNELEKQRSLTEIESKQQNSKSKELTETIEQLQNTLFRRSEECDRLREQIKLQSNELIEHQKLTKDIQIQFTDLQSQVIPKEFELNKLKQENEYLAKELSFYQTEVSTKENAERALRKENSDKIRGLENDIESLKHKLEESKSKLEIYQIDNSTQQEKISSFIEKLKEMEELNSKQTLQFQEENNNLKKLMNLYKNYFDDSTEKILELEQKLEKQKENYLLFQKNLENDFDNTVKDMQNKFNIERTSLQNKIEELQASIQQKDSSTKPFEIPNDLQVGIVPGTSLFDRDGREVTVANLYHQLLNTQKELMNEVNKKNEMEIYLNQILKDIELKAPVFAKQKRDYARLLNSHTQLTQTLDNYVDENTKLKVTIHDLESKFLTAQKELKVITLTNQDLVQQVQHLLKANRQHQDLRLLPNNSIGEMAISPSVSREPSRGIAIIDDELNERDFASPQDVISTHLVTFSNVDELQEKNLQLLSTIRRLTIEREQQEALLLQLQEKTESSQSNSSQVFQDLNSQLNDLRSNQEKSEEMIKILLQQRDMYRSMLTNGVAEGSTPQKSLNPQSPLSMTPGANTMVVAEIADPQHHVIEIMNYQKKLELAEKDNQKLAEKLARFEESHNLLSAELSKTKEELLNSKLSQTSLKTELRYLTERNDRLDSSNKLLVKENTDNLKRRSELEETLLSLQRQCADKDNLLQDQSIQIRKINELSKKKEIDFEVLKASEARLNQQVGDLKNELSNQLKLSDHLYRLETSITTKYEEEKNFYLKEKENIELQLNAYRKETTEKLITNETTIKLMEHENKNLSAKLMMKETEFKNLSDNLLNEQHMNKFNQEKIAHLEKNILLLQEKIANLSGEKVLDSLLEKELQDKELQLNKALLENSNLKNQIQLNEEYINNFKNLSNQNDVMVKELKEKYNSLQQQVEKEKESLLREKTYLQQELSNVQTNNNSLLNELENSRTLIQQKEKENVDLSNSFQQELTKLQNEKNSLIQHYAFIEEDYKKLQQTSTSSYENYERELQLHAESERLLKEEKSQHLKTKEKVNNLEEKVSSFSFDLFNLQQKLSHEKSNYEKELHQSKELIANLQSSNQVLMQQLENSSEKLEKLQQSRVETLLSAGPQGQDSSVDTSSFSQQAFALLQEELNETKKSSLEMKELLKYMKKEKEILSTKINYLELENSRYFNQLNSLNMANDALKLALEQEKSSSKFTTVSGGVNNSITIHSQEEFNLLVKEIEQLNILRESNLHLRSENENLLKKLKDVEQTYSKEKNEVFLPLQEKFSLLQQEKENLELTNDQLTNDISYWKARLHSLISRYNDIDPHEHQQLQLKNEEMSKEIASLTEKVKLLETAKEEITAAKEKELSSAKAVAETNEKSANNLREKLRQFKEKNTELDRQLKEVSKTSTQKDSNTQVLETQLKEAQTKMTELSNEVTELKSTLSNTLKELTLAKLTASSTAAALSHTTTPQPAAVQGEVTTTAPAAAQKGTASAKKPLNRKRPAEATETPAATTSAPPAVSQVEETKPEASVEPKPVVEAAPVQPPAPAAKPKLSAIKALIQNRKPPAPSGPPPANPPATTTAPVLSVPEPSEEPKLKKARIEQPPAAEIEQPVVTPAPVESEPKNESVPMVEEEEVTPQQESITPHEALQSPVPEVVENKPEEVLALKPVPSMEMVVAPSHEIVVAPSHEVTVPPSHEVTKQQPALNIAASPFVPKLTPSPFASSFPATSTPKASFTSNPFAAFASANKPVEPEVSEIEEPTQENFNELDQSTMEPIEQDQNNIEMNEDGELQEEEEPTESEEMMEEVKQPSSNPFASFGANKSTTAPNQSIFGSSQQGPSLFPKANSNPFSSVSGPGFGGAATGIFGSNNATSQGNNTNATTSIFGAAKPATTTTAASIFGGGSLFAGSSAFGGNTAKDSAAAPVTSGFGLFGKNPNAGANNNNSGSLFGGPFSSNQPAAAPSTTEQQVQEESANQGDSDQVKEGNEDAEASYEEGEAGEGEGEGEFMGEASNESQPQATKATFNKPVVNANPFSNPAANLKTLNEAKRMEKRALRFGTVPPPAGSAAAAAAVTAPSNQPPPPAGPPPAGAVPGGKQGQRKLGTRIRAQQAKAAAPPPPPADEPNDA